MTAFHLSILRGTVCNWQRINAIIESNHSVPREVEATMIVLYVYHIVTDFLKASL
jgi:hypothetical protein